MLNASVSRRTQLIGAVAAVAIGLLVAFMIRLHPEGLRAPAWVAYVAASAFVLAGLCLFAGAVEMNWLQGWLGIAATLSLFVVSLWIALGPGERACSMSIPFVQSDCTRCVVSRSLRYWSTPRCIIPRLARAPCHNERFLGGYRARRRCLPGAAAGRPSRHSIPRRSA